MLRYLGIIFLISVSIPCLSVVSGSPFQNTAAAKNSEITIKNGEVDKKDKLVLVSKINIANISKTGMIKIVGAINGEGFSKDISLSKIDEKSKKIKVNFVMNKENE
jgi:hypothetical protein